MIENQVNMIDIQHDAMQVLADVRNGNNTDEKVWLYVNDQRYSLSVTSNSMIEKEGGIHIIKDKKKSTSFRFIKKDLPEFNLCFPAKYEHITSTKSFNFNSVCSSPQYVFLGTDSGSILQLDSPIPINSTPKVYENAHLADIIKIILFPSNEVLLTIGLEMQMKIWNIHDMSLPVRVLSKVHKARITDCVLIGNGRNVVSCGLDGRIVMWELGSGNSIWVGQRVRGLDDGCLCLDIVQRDLSGPGDSERFFECDGKVLVCGHDSGIVSVWSCGNRLSLGEFLTNDEGLHVSKIKLLDDGRLLVCLSNGDVRCYAYSFGEKTAELIWKSSYIHDGVVEVRKLEVHDRMAYVLTNKYFVKIDSIDGKIVDVFVGFDESIFDFVVKENEMCVVGKFKHICSFTL